MFIVTVNKTLLNKWYRIIFHWLSMEINNLLGVFHLYFELVVPNLFGQQARWAVPCPSVGWIQWVVLIWCWRQSWWNPIWPWKRRGAAWPRGRGRRLDPAPNHPCEGGGGGGARGKPWFQSSYGGVAWPRPSSRGGGGRAQPQTGHAQLGARNLATGEGGCINYYCSPAARFPNQAVGNLAGWMLWLRLHLAHRPEVEYPCFEASITSGTWLSHL